MIQLKRVYEPPAASDGYRVLIDGLWPRGLTKAKARVDEWLRGIAVSQELRTWYGHNIKRWPEFQQRYRNELKAKPELLKHLKALEREHRVLTILFAAKDTEHSNAVALLKILKR